MTVGLYKMFSVGAIASSPAVDRGTIYFGSADGNLYALQ
jgi:outer membrane protein assembly factor BamB